MACGFSADCIQAAMQQTIRHYSNGSDNNFDALRTNVSQARHVPVRAYLELADIQFLVGQTPEINSFQDAVAGGFMSHFDTSGDGRINATEWRAGASRPRVRSGVQLRRK